jgi:hypothetical protein
LNEPAPTVPRAQRKVKWIQSLGISL